MLTKSKSWLKSDNNIQQLTRRPNFCMFHIVDSNVHDVTTNIAFFVTMATFPLFILLTAHVTSWSLSPGPWRVHRLRIEERPPIWRVAANILNKQWWTADKGWTYSLGVGRGANNSSLVKRILLRNIHRQRLQTWTDTLVRPKQRKRDTWFGTWKVRSLYRAGSLYSSSQGIG